jgi:hypothetical protein
MAPKGSKEEERNHTEAGKMSLAHSSPICSLDARAPDSPQFSSSVLPPYEVNMKNARKESRVKHKRDRCRASEKGTKVKRDKSGEQRRKEPLQPQLRAPRLQDCKTARLQERKWEVNGIFGRKGDDKTPAKRRQGDGRTKVSDREGENCQKRTLHRCGNTQALYEVDVARDSI